jgi:hypothetical protein
MGSKKPKTHHDFREFYTKTQKKMIFRMIKRTENRYICPFDNFNEFSLFFNSLVTDRRELDN